jgi:threonine/homoserine/homoserine lactone efflux protein
VVHVLSFIALTGLLVAIPGPAVILILKSTLLRGRRSAMLVAVGVLGGDLVWAAAAVGGVTAVVIASRPAFEALRLAGAAYLIYLGLKLLLGRADHLVVTDRVATGMVASSGRRSFGEGMLCELSNPKTLVVFTSVIPQFLSGGADAAAVAGYGVLFALLGFASLTVYVAVVGRTRQAVGRRSRLPRILLRGSGGVLTLFGVGLLADRSV